MTSPWVFQPAPAPNVQPGPVTPAPDYFGQGANNLAQVLQALRQMSQTSQIENRRLDVQQQFDQGQISAKQAENQRLIDEEQYKRQQTAQALAKKQQEGRAFLRTLSPELQQMLADTPPENLLGMVEPLQKSGRVGEMPTSQREFDRYQELLAKDPKAAAQYLDLIKKPPGAVVNVDTKGASAFSTGFGGGQAQRALKNIDESQASGDAFNRDERLLGYAKEAITGAGAGAKLQAARVATLLGLKGFKNDVQATQLLQTEGARLVGDLVTQGLAGRGNLNPNELKMLQQAAGQDISLDAGTIQELTRIRYKMRIADEEARATQLRQDARDYPDNAPQLNAAADRIEQQLKPRRAKLAQMEQAAQVDDRKTVNEQRKKYGLPPLPEGTP